MPGTPVRYGTASATEPVVHDLPPLRYGGDVVPVQLEMRRTEDGVWRGRLLFGGGADATAAATADIFCAASESDLWECVHDLRDHHLRDLYRSVTE